MTWRAMGGRRLYKERAGNSRAEALETAPHKVPGHWGRSARGGGLPRTVSAGWRAAKGISCRGRVSETCPGARRALSWDGNPARE